jgi:maltose alpha-D-glucosyltransferase / alpha-amylase
MRRVIAMRKRFPAFGRGSLEMLYPDNPKVLAFTRTHGEQIMLVVVNLSRFSQMTHIELSRFSGMIPEEVFSRNRYPTIRDTPYLLTLGIHDYYWFRLRPERREAATLPEDLPAVQVGTRWQEILDKGREHFLEEILPAFLERSRWFRSKARGIREIKLLENMPLQEAGRAIHLLLLQVLYTEGDLETYALPVTWLTEELAATLLSEHPAALITPLTVQSNAGVLIDALYDEDFRQTLLGSIRNRRRLRGQRGEMSAHRGTSLRGDWRGEALPSQVVKAEQSNSSILYGDRYFLKLYRGLEEGINPDLEITRFLSERCRFEHVPTFLGSIDYRFTGGTPLVLGMLQKFVPNQGDAWSFTLDILGQFFEEILARRGENLPLPERLPFFLDARVEDLAPPLRDTLQGFYLEMVGLLGQRTAEMHLALGSDAQDPVWRPEEFSTLYQRSVYQSMRSLVRRNFHQLGRQRAQLDPASRELAEHLLGAEKEILGHLARIIGRKIPTLKTRIHGDYHLGQVLYTGKDFVIIDFEGEPVRTLSERRLKRSPLRDVAGMLRSFDYAAQTLVRRLSIDLPGEAPFLEGWAQLWSTYVSGRFLSAYLERLGASRLVPREREFLELMLRAFLLEKAVYELGYEMNNRPGWVSVPLKGIERLLMDGE